MVYSEWAELRSFQWEKTQFTRNRQNQSDVEIWLGWLEKIHHCVGESRVGEGEVKTNIICGPSILTSTAAVVDKKQNVWCFSHESFPYPSLTRHI